MLLGAAYTEQKICKIIVVGCYYRKEINKTLEIKRLIRIRHPLRACFVRHSLQAFLV